MNIITPRSDLVVPLMPLLKRVENDTQRQQQKEKQQFQQSEHEQVEDAEIEDEKFSVIEKVKKEHLLDVVA